MKQAELQTDHVLEAVQENLAYGIREVETLDNQIKQAAERLAQMRENLKQVEGRCAALSAFIEQRKTA